VKFHNARALALGCLFLAACLPIPHREPSTRVIGEVLDKSTGRPVSGAEVTMDGYFTASGVAGPDGRFDLPSETQWHLIRALGDPGCQVTVSALGYRDWRESFFCFDEHTWKEPKDVLLTPN